MASGVSVDPACSSELMTLIRACPRQYRAVIYRVSPDLRTIVVERVLPSSNITGRSALEDWKEFTSSEHLPRTDCRYAVYDFEFDTAETGKKNKIIFLLWSPAAAPIKSKMIYTSSRQAIVSALDGVQKEVQATDEEELEYSWVEAQVRLASTAR
jgi:cofilin